MSERKNKSKFVTHISVVLDKSGSMSNVVDDTIGGFNTFLKDQQDVDGEGTLSLIQFDDQYEVHYDMVNLSVADALTRETYVPRSMTALLDAIGKTIINTEAKIKSLEAKPDKVIFVIVTDGQENSSREYKRDQIMKMVQRKEKEDSWEFIYLGANQDAIEEGANMGIRASSSMTYASNDVGTKKAFSTVSKGMTSYRCSADLSMTKSYFSDEDREEQKDLIDS